MYILVADSFCTKFTYAKDIHVSFFSGISYLVEMRSDRLHAQRPLAIKYATTNYYLIPYVWAKIFLNNHLQYPVKEHITSHYQ